MEYDEQGMGPKQYILVSCFVGNDFILIHCCVTITSPLIRLYKSVV